MSRVLAAAAVVLATVIASSCSKAVDADAPKEGQYKLEWRQVEDANVTIRRKGEGGSFLQDSGRFDLTLSARDRKISGCLLSDPKLSNSSVPARCRMDGEALVIALGDEPAGQEGIEFQLTPTTTTGHYAGGLFIKSMMIPGGKASVAVAEMAALADTPPS